MPELFTDDLDGLPQTTRSGVYYEIEALTPREQWVPGANQTIVVVRVPTEDAWTFVEDMVGRAYFADGALRRDLPEQNPFDPEQWCTKCIQVEQGGIPDGDEIYDEDDEPTGEFEPGVWLDPATGWPLTKWVKYQCTFEAYPFFSLTDEEVDDLDTEPEMSRYVTRRRVPQAKECGFPGGAFKIVDDATPANRTPLMQTGFKVLIYGDLVYTWHRVPVANIPLATMNAALGKINSVTFDDAENAGYFDDPQTVLFSGYDDTNKYFDANEEFVCDLVLHFRYNRGGWNKFLNSRAELVEVSLDGTSAGQKSYLTTDLNELFRAEAP